MENQDKNVKSQLKRFERHLISCPNCGKDILYHMIQCPFCKAEVTSKYYKPMDPDMAKKIKLALAVVGFIIVLVLLVFAG
ncbi:MAG: hypothetical protein GX213_14080 [Clostridiaceae bacterium]|nr:hypothetical protein [Clostridiaceae bacterium]